MDSTDVVTTGKQVVNMVMTLEIGLNIFLY